MCPGSPAAASSTRPAWASTASRGAKRTAGSRLPLECLAGADPAGRLVQRHPPVDADDVRARLAEEPEQLAGADAEVDARDPAPGDRLEHLGRRGQDGAPVVGRGQRPHPGVEQLDRGGAGLDLHGQEGRGDVREPVEQVGPQLRVAVHEGLGVLVIARGAALDQVAGEGEGGSGEPDERGRAQLGGDQADGLGDVRDVVRLQGAQPVEVRAAAEGPVDDRADARLDVQVDADGLERHDDVAEVDGGVHPVPAHRLQGDLGDQLRPHARVEHGNALAYFAVLGQRTPGLAHEPHGRVRHRLATAGPQEGGVGHCHREKSRTPRGLTVTNGCGYRRPGAPPPSVTGHGSVSYRSGGGVRRHD